MIEEQEKDVFREKSALNGKNRSLLSQVLAGILINSIYEMRNYPIVLINTVLSPLSFLVVIVFVSRGALVGEAVEGGFIMSMFSAGVALQGDFSHLKNDFKLQDMVVSSPARWQTFVSGLAAAELVYSLPAFVVLTILAGLYVHFTLLGAMQFLFVLIMMFISSVALGFTLATFSSDITQSFAFSRLISTLFSTIPPVYYPISYIPMPYQYLAYLSPTTYAAEIAQNAAAYISLGPSSLLIDWIILISVTVVLFAVAGSKARWREV